LQDVFFVLTDSDHKAGTHSYPQITSNLTSLTLP
jgi:hypothetical protein